MGSLRQVESGVPGNDGKNGYKIIGGVLNHNAIPHGRRVNLSRSLPAWLTVLLLCIMVSAWILVKTLVAFVPLTTVYGYATPASLPQLLDATAEELTLGLEDGAFTSVDLVRVRHLSSCHQSSCHQAKYQR